MKIPQLIGVVFVYHKGNRPVLQVLFASVDEVPNVKYNLYCIIFSFSLK
jgi:hypothetical protein